MKRQVFFLIVSTVLLASCQREQDWCGAPDINAEVESEQNTRTSISVDESGAGTIYWNPSDKIDVFFGTKKAQYTSQNASDALAATFKTSASLTVSDVSSTNIWGLYPSKSSSCCNGSSITTTLPSTQYGVPNTFDKDIFPAVAHSSSTNLQFSNVCGGIKFNLAYDDIKKITFRGNNNEDLAGTVSISFVDNLPKATIVNGVKEITLTPKTGTTFTKEKDYYFILLPGTLSAGFTMTFTATDGTVGTLNYTDASVTIKRSIFSRKGNMDVYAAFGDGRQPNKVIYYTTSDGQAVKLNNSNVFGANVVSREYVGGRGIITCDGDVTSTGNAFMLCTSLVSIDLPNSVTSIGNSAFAYDTRLISATIPNSVISIGYAAFLETALTSVEIPKSVTSIDLLSFAGCSGLTSITVASGNSNFDSRNNCNAIINSSTNELIAGCMNSFIPNTVQVICERAFYGSTGLSSIMIPASVTSIGSYSFGKCTGLASIVVNSSNPYFDSRNNCNAIIKTNTNELIVGCKNTVIPDSVTGIGATAFFNCSSCTSIVIPSSVTRIGESAFQGCEGLTSITVNATVPSALGPDAFTRTNDCPIYVPAGSVDAYKSAWSEYADRIQAIPESHQAVDLGLSVKWASCNVGASSPEEYGDYFAWGETEPKTKYDWDTYLWGSYSIINKYNATDSKTHLEQNDDAAFTYWDSIWRIPTHKELCELIENCTWEWTIQNGKNGYKVTGRNGNYIFLPAAGYMNVRKLSGAGLQGRYWSSSLSNDDWYSHCIDFSSTAVDCLMANRQVGFSIRPVYGDYVSVTGISLDKSSLEMVVGVPEQLMATVSPSTATDKSITWSSSNTSVVEVSEDGMLTAKKPGVATISATTDDGLKKATCNVTVISPYYASWLSYSVNDLYLKLTSQRIVYSVPFLGSITIRDDGGNFVLNKGEWMIGNGYNGVPIGVSAKDYYHISFSIDFDTWGLPPNLFPLVSFDFENGLFKLDYSESTDKIEGTYYIPMQVNLTTDLEDFSTEFNLVILGED